MNRFIIGIITFFLTFGISTSIVGLLFGFPEVSHSHSSSTLASRNIQKVLDNDVRYGEDRRRAEFRLYQDIKRVAIDGQLNADDAGIFKIKRAKIVENYTDLSSAINVSQTPSDFQYAWKQHMDAWSKEVQLVRSRDLFEENKSEDGLSEVNATWYQVLRIAKRYEAPIKARYLR